MKRTAIVIVIGACALANSSGCEDKAWFHALADLPGEPFFSEARAISADGLTVVGFGHSASGFEAFRWWRMDPMVGLGDLPGGDFYSVANAVSADGSVVVGQEGVPSSEALPSPWSELTDGSGAHAFRWTEAEGMVSLGSLPGGECESVAMGVSADGSIIVGKAMSVAGRTGPPTVAFRWTAAEGMVGLGDLPGGDFYSEAYGVSADGSVIVGYSSSAASGPYPHMEAFYWTAAEGMVGLGDLPGGDFNSFATAVSADGSVIVGYSSSASGPEAFRWTAAEGMVGLGDLPGGEFDSRAFAVSADGSVIVGNGSSDANWSGTEPFVWRADKGMRSLQKVLVDDFGLDLTGWDMTDACGISADSLVIVGYGTNPEIDWEAWVAHIPYIP